MSPTISELIEWCARRTSVFVHSEAIETIAIGSSHGYFGFNPAFVPKSFNFCMTSQDLLHSFCLYMWLVKKCPNIRSVVLFYSLFSNGHELVRSSEKWRCAPCKEALSLEIQYPIDIQQTCDIIRGLGNLISIPDRNDFGFVPAHRIGFFPDDYGAERRAVDHLRAHLRGGQEHHLKAIFRLAQHFKHHITLVVSPARSDYSHYIRRGVDSVANDVQSFLSKERCCDYSILNCLGDNRFRDDMFGDFDHLQPFGAGPAILADMIHHQRR